MKSTTTRFLVPVFVKRSNMPCRLAFADGHSEEETVGMAMWIDSYNLVVVLEDTALLFKAGHVEDTMGIFVMLEPFDHYSGARLVKSNFNAVPWDVEVREFGCLGAFYSEEDAEEYKTLINRRITKLLQK